MSSFTFNEDDVQNIFQEVFLSIIKENRLTQVKDSKMISGWLAMVASNKTIDFMREKIRATQRFAIDQPQLKGIDSIKALFDKETEIILKNIINALSDREKIIISLNLFEERTHKEIGCILGIPVNTISTIISRVKIKLKEQLKNKGFIG
jgi:RNA polymerase sigma-70 factor (ECF subfamily)